ncbi:uncharacterized protein with conserved CXXC pairs [Thermanaerovibrio velox DSM 12556]|uniref:Uncharacterized protein with conserved CXXC pairs n=1 Tax=Thermanaerovibrio velox DSM 12556 TaxID=926567 RepID=H0UPA7_9BACT|nr:UvrB/UvrC motif-containing protein [Thermanaerovibrio velox]EHM09520.1 uncharacterized protein with conserved CXXC pairs [Thermanaerovibrio velox DSM 12556]
MKCERCGREASVNIKALTNGVLREHWLCGECASKAGFSAGPFSISISLKDLLPSMTSDEGVDLVCPSCGLRWSQFRKTGLLGCGGCYDAFRGRLMPLIARFQGGQFHRGKRPSDQQWELKRLREELKAALEEEAYERAAVIRDRIRALEGGVPPACP